MTFRVQGAPDGSHADESPETVESVPQRFMRVPAAPRFVRGAARPLGAVVRVARECLTDAVASDDDVRQLVPRRHDGEAARLERESLDA